MGCVAAVEARGAKCLLLTLRERSKCNFQTDPLRFVSDCREKHFSAVANVDGLSLEEAMYLCPEANSLLV